MIPPIRKAIILAAGLNSRFLPMTKAVPKAMLPIIDKPVIQYLAEEAVAAGIEEIIIVTGFNKEALEQHFQPHPEIDVLLEERGKHEPLKELKAIENMARFTYVEQKEMGGDGHAILCAKDLVGEEPFAVLFGDDIIDGPQPALTQLLSLYKEVGTPVICAERVPKERISQYGVIDVASQEGRRIQIQGLVEKPPAEEAPSEFGVVGKYICTAEVMDQLSQAQAAGDELRLIDGFRRMLDQGQPLHAYEVEGERYDTGNKVGLLKAKIAFALKDPTLKDAIQDMFRQ